VSYNPAVVLPASDTLQVPNRWTRQSAGPLHHDLKKQGFDVDLRIGMSVKQIDEKTFLAIKRCLDEAGAKPVRSRRAK